MDQIKSIMEFVLKEANQAINNRSGSFEIPVKLGNLTNIDSQPNPDMADSVVLCLYGLEKEQANQAYPLPSGGVSSYGSTRITVPLYLNLHLMFVANFGNTNYGDGLSSLSWLIDHFQCIKTLTHNERPDLPNFVDKITLEFQCLGIKDVHDVMRAMGATYRPAIFYKLRTIPFGQGQPSSAALPALGKTPT